MKRKPFSCTFSLYWRKECKDFTFKHLFKMRRVVETQNLKNKTNHIGGVCIENIIVRKYKTL